MTDTNNDAISMDDLFAALGQTGSTPQSASSGSGQSAKAGNDDDTLAELFNLVGDSAVAQKRAAQPAQEPEIDLFSALNIDTSPAAAKNTVADQIEHAARLSERESQLREQQIRSQQWQRELQEREERLRRAEQARIQEAEAKVRREQEEVESRAAEAQVQAEQALQGRAPLPPQQPLTDVQPTQAVAEPIADVRHTQVEAVQLAATQASRQQEALAEQQEAREAEARAAEAAAAAQAQIQTQREAEARAAEAAAAQQAAAEAAAEQARLQAEAQERAALEREAMLRAQAEAAAAEQQAQAQRAAEEAAAKAEAERQAALEAELASQPTQVIKPLSATEHKETPSTAEAESGHQGGIPAAKTAELASVQEGQSVAVAGETAVVAAVTAGVEASAAQAQGQAQVPETAPLQERATMAEPAEERPASEETAEVWERKQEPVKRTEPEKHEAVRPEPTKRVSEPKPPMPVMKAMPSEGQFVEGAYDEEYAEAPVAGSRLGNVIGIILIIIAIICVVLTVLLFTGTINKDTFAIDNAPTGQEMTAEIDGSSLEANNQATYAYAVRGINGETHEAIEVATFGEDGKLAKSSIEITIPDKETGEALLAQLTEEFAENVESSSVTDDKVYIIVLTKESDIDKNGYTELLASTMTNFKEIKQ